MVLDLIGQVLWFGILATPLPSFLLVRKMKLQRTAVRVLVFIGLTLGLALLLFSLSWAILLRNGLGPG